MVGRSWSWGTPLDLVVYPETIPVPVALPGMAKDIEGRPTGQPSEADISFHALREYAYGDDRRAIHWRSSARLGQLMVRQSEDTRRIQMALIVSTDPTEYTHQQDFELAVCAYASLGLAQLAVSGELAVIAEGAILPTAKASPGPLLDHAAAIRLGEIGQTSCSLLAAAAKSRTYVPRATLVLLLTGDKLPTKELRRLSWFLPREAQAVAVSCRSGAELEVRKAGRLGLARIGSLQDLPRVLRRLGMR
jgi:uncharacterized protein (DUF58 family)